MDYNQRRKSCDKSVMKMTVMTISDVQPFFTRLLLDEAGKNSEKSGHCPHGSVFMNAVGVIFYFDRLKESQKRYGGQKMNRMRFIFWTRFFTIFGL